MKFAVPVLSVALALAAPTFAAAQGLSLLAEDNFPANFVRAGELKGISVDLLREAFRRADIPYSMSVVPWARAYDTALKSPDHCVFSAAHTPERDRLFRWVEPLNTIEMVVVAPQGTRIDVKTDDDLRRYTIGTYIGDYREAVLKGMGMRIDSVGEDALNADKLRRGRIDLWAVDSAKLPQLKGEFTPIYTYYKVNLALACNTAVDADVIDRLQRAMTSVHADGTFPRIKALYATAD